MNFKLYKDTQNNWRWRLRAANNKIIADSGEGYVNRQDCIDAIVLVMDTNRKTPIYE